MGSEGEDSYLVSTEFVSQLSQLLHEKLDVLVSFEGEY